MMVGEGDIIQQAMEAFQTFDPLDDFVINHSERPSKQSNVIDAIVSLPDATIPQTLVQELVSSTSQIPETFDWVEDIIDNSCKQSVLTSEIKSCPGMESNNADMKAELALLEDNNFFLD